LPDDLIMETNRPAFHESSAWSTPIRDLGLGIVGSALEPILAEFIQELGRAGIVRVVPRFYLSTEWGVPDGTIAIAIPFYLAHPDLAALQAERMGYVEGSGQADILRYLRHEMGHVINYAYRLHETPEWSERFGSMLVPYLEEYRPEPFSRRYVRHLPGWYAQKHPDEDWAETFAVWLTPGLDWRGDYASWPVALEKLEYCDRTMASLIDRDPLITADDLDEDVSELDYAVEDHYRNLASSTPEPFPDLDAALRSIFEDPGRPEHSPTDVPRMAASAVFRKIDRELTVEVFRWTGSFPERTRPLIRHLADRADALGQVYPADREAAVVVAVTTLITALAMNHVQRGSYLP
jgi:Putative zinc-binding metallo-peptidase